MIDEHKEPWLIEVNLSPSLSCDSPFDQKIKSNLIADLLTLIGVPAIGPKIMQASKNKRKGRFHSLAPSNRGFGSNKGGGIGMLKNNFISKQKREEYFDLSQGRNSLMGSEYTKEERKAIRDTEDELKRSRGFKMLFPNENLLYYEQFFEEKRKINGTVAKKLFGMSSKGHPARVQRLKKAGDFINIK